MLVKTIQTNRLVTQVYETRRESGIAAAKAAAAAIRTVLQEKDFANVIFAAAPSQNEMLEALLEEDVAFERINAFHMDEYVGLSREDPPSFARYLTDHLFAKAPFHSVSLIPARQPRETACQEYAGLLKKNPPDLVCMGIGENGHIAFNDPPAADFKDPEMMKVVQLDDICRQQQVNDKCFSAIDLVPKFALTLTVPALMGAKYLVCTVPGPTKAAAVKAMLHGTIGEHCPATALRLHGHAEMFLDADSAKYVL